ncbi:hypothetical protein FWF93_03285 [Candidatus Saccharibacteria bacterium]|nr:hypothetical protein [Candidatus Saccharibacteria bacterium]
MLLDEQYLKDIGVADLPEDVRQQVADELESNMQDAISIRVAEDLSDTLMDEFDVLNDGAASDVRAWLDRVMPYYASSPEFLAGKEQSGVSDDDFTRSYAMVKWLGMNVPNYGEIVNEVLESSKSEILALREKTITSNL